MELSIEGERPLVEEPTAKTQMMDERPMNEPIHDFGWALRQLKSGNRVSRRGWNGKGMYLFLEQPAVNKCNPYITMLTADKRIQPGWLASQADMLGEDWCFATEVGA